MLLSGSCYCICPIQSGILYSACSGNIMGKIKKYAQEFLDEIGYSLGYDWDNLPSLTEIRFYLNETKLNKENKDKDNQ